jgi:hypothetical protein
LAIPVSDIILDEIPKPGIKPIATDIGNCIRIIKALLQWKRKEESLWRPQSFLRLKFL